MTTQTEKGFMFGHKLALDALEVADKDGKDYKASDVFAGILATLMHGMYAVAPTEEAAEEIISFATATALENWEEEKKKKLE
tara:strand:+ start:2855 stop:3100 length:246 start_codon:yes stop_codon:yes gene_type:complete